MCQCSGALEVERIENVHFDMIDIPSSSYYEELVEVSILLV